MSARFSPESVLGTTLPSASGAYRLDQLLKSGGLAHVYLAARVDAAGGLLAVKLMRPEVEGKPEVVARFDREAAAGSLVRHQNVIRVHEPVQHSRGLAYFACEHLVGVDLADQMASERKLAPERAIKIALGAALGLGAAHAKGVVHRDVKPENIFLVHAPDGREVTRVIDFGSAWLASDPIDQPTARRITQTTTFVGTPGYVAPEQAEGAVGHAAADVYSLGVVLYEALAGRPPFTGKSWMDLLVHHAHSPVPPLSNVSKPLQALVSAALAKAPGDRIPSMTDFYRELSGVPEAR
jgi:eukaryotic-like serine/threonine-protein kinase